jgi:hypothetical protein
MCLPSPLRLGAIWAVAGTLITLDNGLFGDWAIIPGTEKTKKLMTIKIIILLIISRL